MGHLPLRSMESQGRRPTQNLLRMRRKLLTLNNPIKRNPQKRIAPQRRLLSSNRRSLTRGMLIPRLKFPTNLKKGR